MMQVTEKLPPNDIGTEDGFIGRVMLNPEIAPQAIEMVETRDFYSQFSQAVWSAIKSLTKAGITPDVHTVHLQLSEKKYDTPEVIRQRLAQMAAPGHTTPNITDCAEIILEKSRLRDMISLCDRMINECYNTYTGAKTSEQILNEFQDEILSLQQNNTSRKRIEKIADLFPSVFAELEQANAGEESVATSLSTGIEDLDKKTGGMPVGALTVVGGRSGMGKSTFALDVAIKTAKEGKSVVYFALEMTSSQMIKKAIANVMSPNIPAISLFKTNALSPDDWENVITAESILSEYDFWLQDKSTMSISQMRTDIQEVCIRNGKGKVDLVVVDYLQLIQSDRRYQSGNRVLEVDAILKDLRVLAKDYNCVVLGTAQINRGVEARADKRPTMSDFRESGGIENEASVMLGLYREEYYDKETTEKGILEVIALKSRFSDTPTSKVLFDTQYGTFKPIPTSY